MDDDDGYRDASVYVKPTVTYRRASNGRYDGSSSDMTPTQVNKPPRTKVLPDLTDNNPVVPIHNNPRSNTVATSATALDKSAMLNVLKVLASYTVPGYGLYLIARFFIYFPASWAPAADFLGFNIR